jgi:hypothetical protein
MMTGTDESEALSALEAHPPEWLLYLSLSDQEFRRVFPNSGGASARFSSLETWLEQNYTPLDQHPVNIAGYRLYRRSAFH